MNFSMVLETRHYLPSIDEETEPQGVKNLLRLRISHFGIP